VQSGELLGGSGHGGSWLGSVSSKMGIDERGRVKQGAPAKEKRKNGEVAMICSRRL